MNILVLGAGAIGGYYGGRLAEAGAAEVTFLVRERRREQLARDGLNIESRFGNISMPVRAVLAGEPAPPADYVLLTCKAYDLGSAIDSIRPAVGPNTAVLPLLNGLSHMDRLNDAFGRERVLGGVASIATALEPDGVIKHLNEWQYITFGEQDGAMSERVLALKAAFDKTKLAATVRAVPDILPKMWEKIVMLATLAAATTLMRASVGEIARAPGGTELMREMFERNAEIAARAGYLMTDAYIEQYRAMLADTNLPMTASMLRDIERKGPVEADHIVGFMLDNARKLGVDARLLAISYAHLKAYEERRAAGRL